MMYQDTRDERIKIFEHTRQLYESDEKLRESVNNSRGRQIFIAEGDPVESAPHGAYGQPATVTVSRKRSLEAASGYQGQKVCVLNFASAVNPGGGVERGSSAQEEAICRCSTLFACISEENIARQFHHKHRESLTTGQMTSLYNDDCIYTPDVMVFKTDTVWPEPMPQQEWYQVDVLTCAAPDLRFKFGNALNPGRKVKPGELREIHIRRMGRILDIARANGAKVMILGAFGCGAFQNSPEIVADAMAIVIREYLYDFQAIEFAVYCSPKDSRNYDVFHRRLSPVSGS